MTLTSYLVGVASDYSVHMILTSYLVGVAYDHTVYHFECYKQFCKKKSLKKKCKPKEINSQVLIKRLHKDIVTTNKIFRMLILVMYMKLAMDKLIGKVNGNANSLRFFGFHIWYNISQYVKKFITILTVIRRF